MVIAYWIVAGLLALAYLAAGGAKLLQPQEKLAPRMAWAGDFPAWSVKTIGLLEVLGAIGLILPPLTGIAPILAPLAAVGLVLVQLGAVITHFIRREPQVLPANLVLLVLAGVAAWLGFAVWV